MHMEKSKSHMVNEIHHPFEMVNLKCLLLSTYVGVPWRDLGPFESEPIVPEA